MGQTRSSFGHFHFRSAAADLPICCLRPRASLSSPGAPALSTKISATSSFGPNILGSRQVGRAAFMLASSNRL